jgi:hypothetical protein
VFDDVEVTRAVVRFGLPAAVGATTAVFVGGFNDWDATSNLMERARTVHLRALSKCPLAQVPVSLSR